MPVIAIAIRSSTKACPLSLREKLQIPSEKLQIEISNSKFLIFNFNFAFFILNFELIFNDPHLINRQPHTIPLIIRQRYAAIVLVPIEDFAGDFFKDDVSRRDIDGG